LQYLKSAFLFHSTYNCSASLHTKATLLINIMYNPIDNDESALNLCNASPSPIFSISHHLQWYERAKNVDSWKKSEKRVKLYIFKQHSRELNLYLKKCIFHILKFYARKVRKTVCMFICVTELPRKKISYKW
jgi:hypothetical protein